jgi:imidazole glycerol-phosphate synthase subunit HisF
MSKPRLCFTLLYANGNFNVSRNFDLQTVGDLDWLIENYEFDSISRAIDELIILNVSRELADWDDFIDKVQNIASHCFMPIVIGGGVRTKKHAELLFSNGADKIVINSILTTDPELVKFLVNKYGSQSIVASIDFKRLAADETQVYIENGKEFTGLDLGGAITQAKNLNIGEIYLTSIEMDGTGQGYDLVALEEVYKSCNLPIIASGGADTYDKLAEGIKSGYASAVSTSHLFNFMCDGLKDARNDLIGEDINLSEWDFKGLTL